MAEGIIAVETAGMATTIAGMMEATEEVAEEETITEDLPLVEIAPMIDLRTTIATLPREEQEEDVDPLPTTLPLREVATVALPHPVDPLAVTTTRGALLLVTMVVETEADTGTGLFD